MRVEPEKLGEESVAIGRRQMLRGGFGVTPVILTLTSGPVSAGLCTTASAFGSLHPSGQRPSITCGGHSPSVWNTTPGGHWPIIPSTLFQAYFAPALTGINVSLKDVIDPSKGYDLVAQNCVAALLNASTNPPLTPATILGVGYVKAIWSSYATKRFFEPTAGIQWYSDKIVAWIATTYS
jgi:hypothetical protein